MEEKDLRAAVMTVLQMSHLPGTTVHALNFAIAKECSMSSPPEPKPFVCFMLLGFSEINKYHQGFEEY